MAKPMFQMLYEALKALHDDQVEYIAKNNLGLPHHNQVMQQALIALTLCQEQEMKEKRIPMPDDPPVNEGRATQGRFSNHV